MESCIVCPHCGGPKVWIHSRRLNRFGEEKKRFRCTNCKKTRTPKSNSYNENNPKCPKCLKNEHIIKHGKFKKSQVYLCKKCNRSFMDDYVYTHREQIDEKQKLQRIKAWSRSDSSNKRFLEEYRYPTSLHIFKKSINKHYPNEYSRANGDLKLLKSLICEALMRGEKL